MEYFQVIDPRKIAKQFSGVELEVKISNNSHFNLELSKKTTFFHFYFGYKETLEIFPNITASFYYKLIINSMIQ